MSVKLHLSLARPEPRCGFLFSYSKPFPALQLAKINSASHYLLSAISSGDCGKQQQNSTYPQAICISSVFDGACPVPLHTRQNDPSDAQGGEAASVTTKRFELPTARRNIRPASERATSGRLAAMNTNNPFNLYTNIDMAQYQLLSPSGSPAEAAKNTILNRPLKSESLTGSLLPAQNMSGPSFDYDSYQQHTGLVAGSIANTHAINQSLLYGNGYLSNADSGMDFNFNSPLPQASPFGSPVTDTMDATKASPVRQTVDPSRLQSETSPTSLSSANMRVYNGFHTNQAAAAAEAAKSKIKVEAQQIQQQQIIQQQQQQRHAAQSAKPQKPRVQPPADPLLDQKITQVLNRFRQQESSNMDLQGPESPEDANRSQSKDLDDMDEDERLLNSEEGKKLTPKERRQLRNKVSARHFRKRRKGKLMYL